jgi:hypothetical protein
MIMGCGGGGGGDDDGVVTRISGKFAGQWTGVLSVVSNTCSIPAVSGGTGFTVNEDGDRIAVQGSGSWIGFTTSEDSYVVSGEDTGRCVNAVTGAERPNSTATVVTTIEFMDVTDEEMFVRYTRDAGNCTGNVGDFDSSCVQVSEGVFERGLGGLR